MLLQEMKSYVVLWHSCFLLITYHALSFTKQRILTHLTIHPHPPTLPHTRTHTHSHVSISAPAGDDPGHQVSQDAVWGAGGHSEGVRGHPGTVQTSRQRRAIAQPGQAALRAHAGLPSSLWSGEGIWLMPVMGFLRVKWARGGEKPSQ